MDPILPQDTGLLELLMRTIRSAEATMLSLSSVDPANPPKANVEVVTVPQRNPTDPPWRLTWPAWWLRSPKVVVQFEADLNAVTVRVLRAENSEPLWPDVDDANRTWYFNYGNKTYIKYEAEVVRFLGTIAYVIREVHDIAWIPYVV